MLEYKQCKIIRIRHTISNLFIDKNARKYVILYANMKENVFNNSISKYYLYVTYIVLFARL